MKKYYFVIANPFTSVYEETDEERKAREDQEAVEAAAKKKAEEEEAAKAKKTFTQEELNKALAEDRRKHKAQVDKHVSELEVLKKSKSLTDKEKEQLQSRIDELQNSMLTKEQLAAKEREKLEVQHKTKLQEVTQERDVWQNRFISSSINQAITHHAVSADAFDSEAMIAILGPNTKLVEDVDEDGKPINRFTAKVKFSDTDAEGKPITLDLTVEQAIKRMKEMPKYGYLFKNTATAGLGTNGSVGKGGKVDPSKMSPEQYRKWRSEQGLAKKKPGQ